MGLVALICPECAAPFGVQPHRRVHECGGCGGSYASDGHVLRQVPRQIVAPRRLPPGDAALVFLPVWCLRIHTDRMGSIGARLPEEIRVPAVGWQRLPLLMQFARNLTRAPVVWSPWTGVSLESEAAEIEAVAAFEIAEMVALRHVEGWPADDEIEGLDVPFGMARLLDWPCALRGREIVDLVAGISAPSGLLESCPLRDRREALGEPLLELLGSPSSTP